MCTFPISFSLVARMGAYCGCLSRTLVPTSDILPSANEGMTSVVPQASSSTIFVRTATGTIEGELIGDLDMYSRSDVASPVPASSGHMSL